jgi:serine/threonine-protein kinase
MTRRFGDYTLVRDIGRGASATVYLAQHRVDGNWLALKILSALEGVAADQREDWRARFLQEVAIARQLRHPNIVAVHDAGETAGSPWIAMELVPGCALTRYVHPVRLLPVPVVLGICACTASALEHAHARGVIHRDIKPSNVLVDLAAGSVKLSDFGTARLLDSSRTRTELMVGTPAYMAPEQLAGSVADAATDLYALGVLLFELLTGRRPHEAASMGELLRRVAAEPAPDVLRLRPDLPPRLGEALARLLAKRPADRPTSAGAVAAILSRLAPGSAHARAEPTEGPKSR